MRLSLKNKILNIALAVALSFAALPISNAFAIARNDCSSAHFVYEQAILDYANSCGTIIPGLEIICLQKRVALEISRSIMQSACSDDVHFADAQR